MQYLMAAGIPALPAVVAFAFAIRKDGSPFCRSFWT